MSPSSALPRRTALKAGFATLAALAVGRRARFALADGHNEPISYNELYNNPPLLGHVVNWHLPVTPDPPYGDPVRYLEKGEVVPIYGAAHIEPRLRHYPHNDLWFDVGEGYVHSAYVVPVREQFNQPEEAIGDGFWGEISVPYSVQHRQPKAGSAGYYRMAYRSVFFVVERADDDQGTAWYRLYQEQNPGGIWWWVRARDVRRLRAEDFAPISPDVPPEAKRIVINLSDQLLTCYENDSPVFSTRIASGTGYRDAAGRVYGFETPVGEHRVTRKTPARHMIGGPPGTPQFYDLPGVPWCTYFASGGAAIHGTYWHNDFGRPRSNGCVNVTGDAAHWVYRWTTPSVGAGEGYYYYWTPADELENATAIIIEK